LFLVGDAFDGRDEPGRESLNRGTGIRGDLMQARLDGTPIPSLGSPGIADPTETTSAATMFGSAIDFDDRRVYKTGRHSRKSPCPGTPISR
jgi:hypothetical protein